VPTESFLDTLELSPKLCLRLLALLTDRLRLSNEPLKRYPQSVTEPAYAEYLAIVRQEEDQRFVNRATPMDAEAPIFDGKGHYVAERSPFYNWVTTQMHRSDAVGVLARYVSDDPTWPQSADDIEQIRVYMDIREADVVVRAALPAAWRTWLIEGNRADHRVGHESE
jgi:uncharacterized protein YozE (UPF0346 family)